MTNTSTEYCIETHKDGWMCCYPLHHRGDHKAWGGDKAKPYATWPQEQKYFKRGVPLNEQPSMFAKGGIESKVCPSYTQKDGYHRCQLKEGHPGSHLKTFLTRDTITWKDEPLPPGTYTYPDTLWAFVNGRGHGKTYASYHAVVDADVKDVWDKLKAATTPQPIPVPLDAEELKILAYYLASVNEDDEDDVALKEKIDAALKKAL